LGGGRGTADHHTNAKACQQRSHRQQTASDGQADAMIRQGGLYGYRRGGFMQRGLRLSMMWNVLITDALPYFIPGTKLYAGFPPGKGKRGAARQRSCDRWWKTGRLW